MSQYHHYVSGIFANRTDANTTQKLIIKQGLIKKQLQIYESDAKLPATTQQAKSNRVLKDMFVDGAIGAAIGSVIGGLIQIALIATNVRLFIASPLVAPLALLGWGASLGAMAGATYGAKVSSKKQGWLSDFVKDAITSGQVVLVAETNNQQQTKIAQNIIHAAVGNHKDISSTWG